MGASDEFVEGMPSGAGYYNMDTFERRRTEAHEYIHADTLSTYTEGRTKWLAASPGALF